jgi:hypothetical protein
VYLIDLLPPPHTHSQYASIHRAARSLARKGRIVSHGVLGLVSRPGYDLSPNRWPRMLSVWKLVDGRMERRLVTDEEHDRLMEERRRQSQSVDVDLWVRERNLSGGPPGLHARRQETRLGRRLSQSRPRHVSQR